MRTFDYPVLFDRMDEVLMSNDSDMPLDVRTDYLAEVDFAELFQAQLLLSMMKDGSKVAMRMLACNDLTIVCIAFLLGLQLGREWESSNHADYFKEGEEDEKDTT